MENIQDGLVVVEGVDTKEISDAIEAVAADVGAKPTKIVGGKGKVAICYRPWFLEVFLEALITGARV